jgi:hypothetical protein
MDSVIDGFGIHDPGKGRYNQAQPEWDMLHPGRPWVARMPNTKMAREAVIEKVRQTLDH